MLLTVILLIVALGAFLWLMSFNILLLVDLTRSEFLLAFCLDKVRLASAPPLDDLANLNIIKSAT